jgi:hypothetical protein
MPWWILAVLGPALVGVVLVAFPRTRRIGLFLLTHGRGGAAEDWRQRQEQAREEDAAIASHDFESDPER